MQPSRLDLDANSSSASKEWCHWFVTFENYIEVLDASLAGERRTNKLKALVNCVSHRVFEYIADCNSYDEAITVLRNLYKKGPNEVFARHLLATAKQQPRVALTAFCSNHERDKTHSTTTQSRTCFELDHAQLQLQLHQP